MTEWLNARPVRVAERLLVACVILVLWGLDTHGTFAGSGDEPHYQMIAHSLAFDRDFDLANDYADAHALVGGGELTPGLHVLPGRNGVLRPVHDVGLPIVAAPYFAAAYAIAERSPQWISPRLMARARLNPGLVLRHLLSLGMIVVTAVMAVLLFHIFRGMLDANAPALLWALACVLSPPLLSHSFLFFTEIPTALIVAFCYRALRDEALPGVRIVAMLGVAVGFLLLLHIRNLGLVAGMIALFLWRMRRERVGARTTSAFIAPIMAFAAFRTLINLRFWGTFVTTPIAAPAAAGSAVDAMREIGVRVLGLLFDQEHGLLLYAPLYLLVIPGALALRRMDRRALNDAAVLCAAYIIPVLLPFVNPHGWSGGWSPAARFLVPVTPLFAVMAFGYVACLTKLSSFVIGLLAVQTSLDALFWSHPKLLWNDGIGRSALADFLSRGVDVGRWLPSWHRPTPYTVAVSVMVLAIWIAASFRAELRRHTKPVDVSVHRSA